MLERGSERERESRQREESEKKRLHVDETGLAHVGGDKLAAELDGGEEEGEVAGGLVVVELVLEDMAGEGDDIGVLVVGHR